jgi:regulator of RNase E activity RraA
VNRAIPTDIALLLNEVSTATICTQLFKRGFRNRFLYGLAPLNPSHARFVGSAFTLRYIPAREDLDVVSAFEDPAHPQRAAIEAVMPGEVLVMDSRGDGRAATAGDILISRLQVRGAVAVITDGSFRDTPRLRRMSFPAFAPIACAGVSIYPGDVLVGDEEGVVCIPAAIAAEVAADAVAQEHLEEFIQTKIAAGAPIIGTYPPNQSMKAEYEQHRLDRADLP